MWLGEIQCAALGLRGTGPADLGQWELRDAGRVLRSPRIREKSILIPPRLGAGLGPMKLRSGEIGTRMFADKLIWAV